MSVSTEAPEDSLDDASSESGSTRWAEMGDEVVNEVVPVNSDCVVQRVKEAKIAQSTLQKSYEKHLKARFPVEVTTGARACDRVVKGTVQELHGKQIVSIGEHTYELGSLVNVKKKPLTTTELQNDWVIHVMEMCPGVGVDAALEVFLAAVKNFQGPGCAFTKAAAEAFKCKLSLRGIGAEGDKEHAGNNNSNKSLVPDGALACQNAKGQQKNRGFVPKAGLTAKPALLIAAKNDKYENLLRAITWAEERLRQSQKGTPDEDSFEAKIHKAHAAFEAAKKLQSEEV